MGGGSYSSDMYKTISSSYKSKSKDDIFTSSKTDDDMSPKNITFRESRDSEEHPDSLAILISLDVTGSMGRIPEIMVREKLGPLMETLLTHNVAHPQILFGAIGDQFSDKAPLQIGQYESETTKLNNWLTKTYLEGNGGGQNKESYLLAWYLAGRHTSIDCFEKRQKKGFLFTIGDEMTWEALSIDNLTKIFGGEHTEGVTAEQVLAEAQRMYYVFHIHVNEGSYKNNAEVLTSWKTLLGQNLIILDDYNAIAETIASTVAIINGTTLADVVDGFDKDTAKVVSKALVNINSAVTTSEDKTGIVTL